MSSEHNNDEAFSPQTTRFSCRVDLRRETEYVVVCELLSHDNNDYTFGGGRVPRRGNRMLADGKIWHHVDHVSGKRNAAQLPLALLRRDCRDWRCAVPYVLIEGFRVRPLYESWITIRHASELRHDKLAAGNMERECKRC